MKFLKQLFSTITVDGTFEELLNQMNPHFFDFGN